MCSLFHEKIHPKFYSEDVRPNKPIQEQDLTLSKNERLLIKKLAWVWACGVDRVSVPSPIVLDISDGTQWRGTELTCTCFLCKS